MRQPKTVLFALALAVSLLTLACPQSKPPQTKVTVELLQQVSLRKQQLSTPSAETLARMRELGMRTEPVNVQRIFIYMKERPTAGQMSELKGIGVTPYPESWVPPVGTHPTGYLLADMPVDSLDALASKDFVVRLDTAEKSLQPQGAPGVAQ